MRHSWQTSPVTVILIIVGAGLVGSVVFSILHSRRQQEYLVSAVTHQMDAHSSSIAALLSGGGGRSPSQLEDAVFEELQRAPSTSLITREMVSVRQSTGSLLECVIDTTSLGLQARRIQQARATIPTP